MDEIAISYLQEENSFLNDRKWQRWQCHRCSAFYYAKKEVPNCGSHSCENGYRFLSIPASKKHYEYAEVVKLLGDSFARKGYVLHPPIPLVRQNERTLFASTAGQIYDRRIYGGIIESEPANCFVAQPVIRLQNINSVATAEGFLTSFVHIATECWNPTLGHHFSTFDIWLDAISQVDLYMGAFCLKIASAINDWAGKKVQARSLKINYLGLEIGIANYFFGPLLTGGNLGTLSDIGLGVERLIWAINKTTSCLDEISPVRYGIITPKAVLDGIRTATLMVGSGVHPEHKNHGSKLRMVLRPIYQYTPAFDLYELVRFYYQQWSEFLQLPISENQTYKTLRRELDRNRNLYMNELLHTSEPINIDHEQFLRSLVIKKRLSLERLKQFMRQYYGT